jgi:hypothetical protein
LSNFCVIGYANCRATNVPWATKLTEQCKKREKRMSDSLLQFFWKNSSRLPASSSPISSSFLVHFEWLKTWWVCQLGLYKTSLYSRGKDAMIKNLKFKILICFNSPITKHSTTYTKHPISYLFFYWIESFFLQRWKRAKNVIWASE